MKAEPLISILVPVYNTEEYLQECLDSIVNQSYQNLEVILINDGSTDASGEICDRYASQDKRIRVIHKENQGVAIARNVALAAAAGDYICFVDSDDYIDLEMCAHIVEAFQATQADVVTFGYYLVYDSGRRKEVRYIHTGEIGREEALLGIVAGTIGNYFWGKAYTREVLANIECPPGKAWEDMGTMYKIFLKAEKLFFVDEKLYYYRQRMNSIVHTIGEKALCDIFNLQKERYDVLMGAYPQVAEAAFDVLALSAIRLYDRSLWNGVNSEDLQNAEAFLRENKAKVLSLKNRRRYIVYFYNRSIYNACRIFRHRIGNIVKSMQKSISNMRAS